MTPGPSPANGPGFAMRTTTWFFSRATLKRTSPRWPFAGPCVIAFSTSVKRSIGGTCTLVASSSTSHTAVKRSGSRMRWSDKSILHTASSRASGHDGASMPASTSRSSDASSSTARSAATPSVRHHSAIAFSVLKRKCGSRCALSARSCARSASRARSSDALLETHVAPEAPSTGEEERDVDDERAARGHERGLDAEEAREPHAEREHDPCADRREERHARDALNDALRAVEEHAIRDRRDEHEREAQREPDPERVGRPAVDALRPQQRNRDAEDRYEPLRREERHPRAARDRPGGHQSVWIVRPAGCFFGAAPTTSVVSSAKASAGSDRDPVSGCVGS